MKLDLLNSNLIDEGVLPSSRNAEVHSNICGLKCIAEKVAAKMKADLAKLQQAAKAASEKAKAAAAAVIAAHPSNQRAAKKEAEEALRQSLLANELARVEAIKAAQAERDAMLENENTSKKLSESSSDIQQEDSQGEDESKIMGIPKTWFWVSIGFIGLVTIGGIVYSLRNK